jgi:hypothetical protein
MECVFAQKKMQTPPTARMIRRLATEAATGIDVGDGSFMRELARENETGV